MKRVSKRPMSDSKVALLKAAGELVAERGVDAMALREITERAGANIASVNYHFGSREGLVLSLVSMHLQPLWEERRVRMEAAEKKWGSKMIPLEELVDLWVRPVSGLVQKSVLGEVVCLRVTGRMLWMPLKDYPEELKELIKGVMVRYQKALAKALPGVAAKELVWRMDWLHGAMARMLVGRWGEGGTPVDQLDAVCAAFVRFSIAALRVGVSEVAVQKPAPKGPQETFDF